MFENQLEELLKDRKEINNCDDFTKITTLWNNIKKNHIECKEYIDNINKEINHLIQEDTKSKETLNISFENAFKELKEIAEKIKTCKLSDLAESIQKIKLLKTTCLDILNKEKCKIQEVK